MHSLWCLEKIPSLVTGRDDFFINLAQYIVTNLVPIFSRMLKVCSIFFVPGKSCCANLCVIHKILHPSIMH